MFLNKKNISRINNYFNSVKGSKRIPYRLGSRYIWWFSGTRLAHEVFYKGREEMFSEFLESLPRKHDQKEAFRKALNSNHLKGWRSSSISWIKLSKIRKIVTINGLEHLENVVRDGKGAIILNSHFGMAGFGLTLFPLLGYSEYYTIIREKGKESQKFEGLNTEVSPKLLAFKDNSHSELFKQMYKAREILNKGGIIHLLGDGYHGMSSNTLTFLGKIRGFRPSYVELSMASGAEVLPIFIDSDPKGKVIVDILPPLDKGNEAMSADEIRDHMTRQYAKVLEERWIDQPWNVNWRFIEKHMYQLDADQ